MRVWIGDRDANEEERGGLPHAHAVLKAAAEPMVLLKLYYNEGHPHVQASKEPDYYPKRSCGSEMDEALLIPVSAFERLSLDD